MNVLGCVQSNFGKEASGSGNHSEAAAHEYDGGQ